MVFEDKEQKIDWIKFVKNVISYTEAGKIVEGKVVKDLTRIPTQYEILKKQRTKSVE